MDVIKCADYLIDLGPDGGENGGHVVAQGTPEEVAATPGSATGSYLRTVL
jgi:excinuclease ABC subunit A